MSRSRLLLLAALVALSVLTAVNVGLFLHSRTPAPAPSARAVAADFMLLDHLGRAHRLYDYAGEARALVILAHGIGCPVVSNSIGTLREARDRFAGRGVAFIALNANPQDSRPALVQEAEKLGIDVPILKDDTQLVAGQLGIARTGDVLVLDTRNWEIVYHGPMDDRLYYEIQRPRADRRYLDEALDALLSGSPQRVQAPASVGCLINTADSERIRSAHSTWAADVVPILREKCLPCHRPGGAGPWVMDRYETVKGWSAMMREVIMNRRMPPWHADPHYGRFSPDRSLSTEQMRTLVHWIDAGSPRGPGPDPLAGQPPAAAPEWPLGPPDTVVEVPEQKIPARGQIDYRYVTVPLPYDRDVWVRAVDLRPGNEAVMHHAFAFIQYPEPLRTRQPDWGEGIDSYFAGYVPGYDVIPFPRDSGTLVPRGATLLFQLHYTSVGYDTSDRTRLGIYLHRDPPAREFVVASAANVDIVIPPRAREHEERATHTLVEDVTLHAFFPHMHYRGARMRYDLQLPDGQVEPLLSVPRYHFNWQSLYHLAEPRDVPAGSTIVVTGAFDNSERNPANPDPDKEVRWGLQSWEEMFIGYFLYTRPRHSG